MQHDYTYSIPWNLLLITLGSILFSLGIKGIAVHHQFVAGGVFGVSLLLYYLFDLLTPGVWYFLLNIPLFFIGWIYVSRRFFFYSLYAMVVATLAYELIQMDFHIQNQVYAAVAAGVISGAGAGVVLRSLGSNGGLDILAVICFQKFNIGIGKFYFFFNGILFTFLLASIEIDLVIASLIMVFITSVVVDSVLSMFSQRKMVFIISDKSDEICAEIQEKLKQGATYIMGKGAYSKKDKNILLTVVNNIQLKRLEEIVFTLDNNAFFVAENTFNVMGSSFSKRKLY